MKREVEQMEKKLSSMACQTLVARVEYCFENLEMR